MQKIYIIKKNGELYKNLNKCYTTEKYAHSSLVRHLEILLPKINNKFKEYKVVHKDITLLEMLNQFEIVEVEI